MFILKAIMNYIRDRQCGRYRSLKADTIKLGVVTAANHDKKFKYF